MRFLFLAAAFLSSALLFVVEPMAAKMILPTFGGAPQVWNTSLLFFQAALLLGYSYAHFSARNLKPLVHPWVHVGVAVLAGLALPISIHTSWFAHIQAWAAADKPPIPLVLLALAGLVGAPFFALCANSSTLQRWYSQSGRPDAAQPWFLYSAGNVGSMLALVAYPAIIEPNLSLSEQGRFWSWGYSGLLVLLAACGLLGARARSNPGTLTQGAAGPEGSGSEERKSAETDPSLSTLRDKDPKPNPDRKLKLTWLALAAVPSSLLLGVTTYLTSNIAPIPLLWVIPLAVYLLTFILIFARKPITPVFALGRIYPLILTPLVLVIVLESTLPILSVLHLAVFFVAAWMCHSRLAQLKPSADHLTEFYFYIALGGVLGGAFNALVAPVTFDTLAEYPIALVAAALLMPKRPDLPKSILDAGYPAAIAGVMIVLVFLARWFGLEAGAMRTFLTIGLPVILCFVAVDSPTRFGLSIAAGFLVAAAMHVSSDGTVPFTARSFFGVHRIVLMRKGQMHKLVNGNTIHGVENMDRPDLPLTYYYPTGPIGQVMQESPPRKAAFVGLGVGSLAAYGHPGQSFTFYEIDPIVRRVATDPKWFTFISNSKADVNIVLGDARLEMAKSPDRYDLIVLDAFSSDAIPIHLLTTQAIQMYLQHLNPNGMVAFHISNRYLDLEPILSAAAQNLRMVGYSQDDAPDPKEAEEGKQASIWAIMAPSKASFKRIKRLSWWSEFEPTSQRVWTDDYSDVIAAFKSDS